MTDSDSINVRRDPAVVAWYAEDEEGICPSEVWWDSTKDAWCGGYEEGMKVPSVAERIVKALPACLGNSPKPTPATPADTESNRNHHRRTR